jgi:hypothetical protein
MANTPTPRVPIQTPMFNEDSAAALTLTRTWVIFFERLGRGNGGGGAAGPYQRTVLLKDTTVGNDIADHVTVWGAAGTISIVTGVLRVAIASDLTLRIKIDGVTLGSFTIPHATAVDTPIEFTTFAGSPAVALEQVFSWDVTASDGSIDAAGVASFTVSWQ